MFLRANPVFLPSMSDSPRRQTPEAQADQRISDILRAADSWSREAPRALTPAIRAVCIRLAEMVADQRHYLAPLPEPHALTRTEVVVSGITRYRVGPASQSPRSSGVLNSVQGGMS